MNCPCNDCNGILDERKFHGFWGFDANYAEELKEEPKTIWERIAKVSDELKEHGVPAHFINELNDICDTIDSLDSELLKLQKYDRGTGSLEHDIGKLSQKLY